MDKSLIELIFKYLSWPVVATVAILVFRHEIKSLIARMRTISTKGIDISDVVQKGSDQPELSSMESPRKPFEKWLDSDLYKRHEAPIVADLKKVEMSPQTPLEKELVKFLTIASISHTFSVIYINIYGSQLAALRALNTTRRAKKEDLRQFYDLGKKLYPELYKVYSFEQWATWLINMGLINEQGDEIIMTEQAIEFLKYVINQGYPDKIG